MTNQQSQFGTLRAAHNEKRPFRVCVYRCHGGVVFRCAYVVALMAQVNAQEKLFMNSVMQIAKMNGWLIHHPTPHQVRPGVFRSDGAGVPDLMLVSTNGRGIIWAELKIEAGRLSPIQEHWGNNIKANGGEYYVWRPSQIDLIAERLGKSTP